MEWRLKSAQAMTRWAAIALLPARRPVKRCRRKPLRFAGIKMKTNKLWYYVAIGVTFLGLALAFSPHAVHHAVGFASGDHITYIYVGIVIFVLGSVGLVYFGKKA
jgi:hypothetical protein